MTGRKKWADEVRVENPGRITPGAVSFLKRCVAPITRILYRPTLDGIRNLPEEGPFLLVGNHSAGMGMAEILSFSVKYIEQAGHERPLAGFALPAGFHFSPLSAVLRCLGAIPSTYAAAEETLAMGIPILVFPGGDHESLRSIRHANKVDFGGRLGFLRIARAAQVPIVPMGIRGSHFTAPVLFRSRILADLLVLPRCFGIKRWGISVLGLLGAGVITVFLPLPWIVRALLVWLWLGTPFVFLPWIPWKIRMRIGKPLFPEDLFDSRGKPSDKPSGKRGGGYDGSGGEGGSGGERGSGGGGKDGDGKAGRAKDSDGKDADLLNALRIVETAVQALVDKGRSAGK